MLDVVIVLDGLPELVVNDQQLVLQLWLSFYLLSRLGLVVAVVLIDLLIWPLLLHQLQDLCSLLERLLLELMREVLLLLRHVQVAHEVVLRIAAVPEPNDVPNTCRDVASNFSAIIFEDCLPRLEEVQVLNQVARVHSLYLHPLISDMVVELLIHLPLVEEVDRIKLFDRSLNEVLVVLDLLILLYLFQVISFQLLLLLLVDGSQLLQHQSMIFKQFVFYVFRIHLQLHHLLNGLALLKP